MFPIPTKKFVPKTLQDNINNFGQALIDYLDSFVEELRNETINLRYFYTIERIPAQFLDTLGQQLESDFTSLTTERGKRIEILNTIKKHKKRGTFEDDVKLTIDSLVGGDSQILHATTDSNDWILGGDGNTIPLTFYWSTLGGDGVDDDLGITLIGAGTEIEVAGNVYIDVDDSTLTAEQQTALINALENIHPAYFRIFLGYINGSGIFVVYTYIG